MWMANGSVYYFYWYLQMALRENYIIRIKQSLKKETEIDYTRKKKGVQIQVSGCCTLCY